MSPKKRHVGQAFPKAQVPKLRKLAAKLPRVARQPPRRRVRPSGGFHY